MDHEESVVAAPYWLKQLLVGLWFFLAAFLYLPVCVVRFNDPSLFKNFLLFFGPLARWIFGIRVEIEGLTFDEVARIQPCVFVGNHQSGLDLITFSVLGYNRCVSVGKRELLWIPLLGFIMWAGGNIMIDRKKTREAKGQIAYVAEEMKQRNVSLVFMPEGTRNRTGVGMLPFKKGAFYVAIEAQVPVIAFVSSSLGNVMDEKRRRILGGTVRFRVLPPFKTEGLLAKDAESLSQQVRQKMIEAFDEISRVRT